MDFALTEQQQQFRDAVRDAAEREFSALAATAEEEETTPRRVFAWAAELGILGLGFPEEYGGGGADKLTSVLAVEELARVNSGLAGEIMSQSGVATEAILRHGSEYQRQAYLPPTFRGEKVGCIAITEPDTGSDIKNLCTTASRQGGGFRLRGEKIFASNATIADYVTVLARMEGTRGRHGLTMFLVDTDNDGYVRQPQLHKLGHRSADTGHFLLQDAWVAEDAIIGEPGRGLEYVGDSLTAGRIDFTARCIGVARRAMELAMEYAGQRHQFGHPIGHFQAIRFKLARMATEIEASRSMLWHATWRFDEGLDVVKEACMCKLYSSEMAQRATWESMQIHGAYGYTREFEIERLYRDARLFTLSEGTSEMQQIMIARELGVPS